MSDTETLAPAHRQRINIELARFVHGQSPFIAIGSMGIALLVCVMLWESQPHHELLIWLSVVTFFSLLRYALAMRFPESPDEAQALRWRNIAIFLASLSGLVWGTGLWHFTDLSHPFESAVLIVIGAGMTSTSFASTAAYAPATHYTYSFATMGILALGYASTGERFGYFIALLNVIYIVMLRVFASRSHRNMVEQIRLRLETAQLAEELEQQRARAESANEAKSRFLAAASHDLRQPLQAVTIFSDLLAEGLEEGEHRDIAKHLQAATDSLTRLFNALLDISLLDAGKLKPQLRDMPLTPLINRLHHEYREQAAAQRLELRVECHDLAVHSDPTLLENILRNLIGNALRYTPRGEVVVRCSAIDEQVRVEVQDTGIGIPAAEQEEIFEEFHQAGNPLRDRQQGLGLGLAIVRRTATLLGAAVTVESEPGRGSTFTLTLPLSHSPLPHDAPITQGGPLNGMVVAVVDDEAEIRDGFTRLLNQWGCTTLAGDSLAAVQQALQGRQLRPDVVLSDYRLRDGENGVEVITGLRQCYGDDLPALIITGESASEQLRQIEESGLPMLSKPIAPARLRSFLLRNAPR